jgi:ABC-type multidrug transport system fused ATPase/permease subunit
MENDLKQLPHGAGTEIGERGTTLSGGQQQRLGIARALYAAPRLLILDDPLAAVDPEVGNAIFERAVLGHARSGGGVLMVLNQIHFLSHFDHIVRLDNGKVRLGSTYVRIITYIVCYLLCIYMYIFLFFFWYLYVRLCLFIFLSLA